MQKLNPIWKSKDIEYSTKLELYRVLALSIATYGAETWTLKKTDEQRLRVFEMACLRKISGVTRKDRIQNTKIRDRLQYHKEITHIVRAKKLKYLGHIKRMDNRGSKSDIKHFCESEDIPLVAAAGHLPRNRDL